MINISWAYAMKAIILFICIIYARSTFSQERNLVVSIQGFRSDQGRCLILLFDKPEGFPKKTDNALHKLNCRIVKGECRFTVHSLPTGSYALSVLHDENDNGKLDMSWYGKPLEGIGASNDAMGLFGPPKFQQASIRLVSQDTTISIRMKYY